MKTTLRWALSLTLLAGLMPTSEAFAGKITISGDNNYRQGSGGEFNVVANDAAGAALLGAATARGYVSSGANGTAIGSGIYASTGFETFCIEVGQFISLPGTYDASISDGAKPGGPGGNGTIDRIGIGTAYLYSAFATMTLSSYNYTPGSGRAADAALLQQAIWYLENEISLTGGQIAANKFLSATTGFLGAITKYGAAVFDDANGQFGVGALNLGAPPGFVSQDQLIMVPDGGATLILLGAALSGLGLIRRRLL
jgi:hypothetical protein